MEITGNNFTRLLNNNSFVARLIKIILTLVSTIMLQGITGSSVFSQNLQFGGSVIGGFPRGEFHNNVERNGIGIEGFGGYNLTKLPITFGVTLGYLNYGTTSRNERLNPSIPEVSVEIKTTNNIFTGHFFTRFEYPKGPVKPYIEGQIGFNHLFTVSKVKDRDDLFEKHIASTTNFYDTALSAGSGAGIKIKIFNHPDPSKNQTWFLNIRAKYLLSEEVAYLKEGDLQINNENLIFDSERSDTKLITAGLGIVVEM